MLQDSGEGIVTRILDNNMVEVEIEDGFQIPVLASQVVVVHQQESRYFDRAASGPTGPGSQTAGGRGSKGGSQAAHTERVKPKLFVAKGLYLAYVPVNDKIVALHLLNHTDYTVLYAISQQTGTQVNGLVAGQAEAGQIAKVKEYNVKEFDTWAPLLVQLLRYHKGVAPVMEPLVKWVKPKAATYHKNKRMAPILNKEAHLLQIDQEAKAIDPETLKEKMMAEKSAPAAEQADAEWHDTAAPRVVDLHIEELTDQHQHMDNAEMLALQMRVFEQMLDKAIASGHHEITFIHGVGNGVLKKAIQKHVSGLDSIAWYKDAMKEKFGYGATLVHIK